MLWLVLSLCSAVSQSTSDLFGKKTLQNLDEYEVAFFRTLFAFLCILPLFFFTDIPNLDITFWLIVLFWVGIVSSAIVLYMRAIKLSPLSLTIPMLAFTPLFLLITSPLILGEFPTFLGFIGILLIVFGTYTLSIKDLKKGYLEPFLALSKEKGALLMLIVAFIFSIGSNFFKMAIQLSNPFFFSVVSYAFLSAVLFFAMLTKSKKAKTKIRFNIKTLFATGFFEAIKFILASLAIELVIVTYVVSVRRTSILFSTIYGYLFFKEKQVIERITGAFIMFIGVMLIILF